jgi:hypothetical protein
VNASTRRLVYMATVLVVCGCVQPQGQTQQSASASSAGMPVVRTDVLPTHGTVVTAEGGRVYQLPADQSALRM